MCQPVWDGIDDGELGNGESNGTVYIQDVQYRNLNMHIITDKAGNGANPNGNHIYTYGKTYGSTRHQYKHDFDIDSIDMMTGVEGTIPIFAIHSGEGQYLNGNSTGNYIKLICKDDVFNTSNKKRGIRYLHLHSSSNLTLNSSTFFMSGQTVALASRSGIPATYPDHCHMDYGAGQAKHQASILNNINEIDNYNRVCIPHYNLPLILPCIPERGNSIANCNFSNSNANYCWAAKELICPALSNHTNSNSDSQQIRVIQAQLKYLGYYVGSNALLDNNKGTALNDAIIKYKTNNIDGLPIANSNSPVVNIQRKESFDNNNDVSNEITELLCSWLNNETNF